LLIPGREINGLDADHSLFADTVLGGLLDKGYRLAAIGGSDNHDAVLPVAKASDLRVSHDSSAPSAQTLANL
jgi:hypothetical protein